MSKVNRTEREAELAFQGSIRDLANIFFKRLPGIVLIIGLTLLVAITYRFVFSDDLYEFSAKLLVRVGPEQALPTAMVGDKPSTVGYRLQDVRSEVEILTNLELLGRVVDKFGLDNRAEKAPPDGLMRRVKYELQRLSRWFKDSIDRMLVSIGLRPLLSDRDKAIYMIREGLAVYVQGESNVIIVTMMLPFREGGSELVNELVQQYLQSRQRVYQSDDTLVLFQEKSDSALQALNKVESELNLLETDFDVISLATQEELLLQRIAETEKMLDADWIEKEDISGRYAALRAELAKEEPDVGAFGSYLPFTLPEQLLTDLSKLQQEREVLRLRDFDDSVEVRNNRQQFNLLAQQLLSHLKSRLANSIAMVQARETLVAELKQELDTLHEKGIEWKNLRRQAEQRETSYNFYQQKLELAEAAAAVAASSANSVSVIQYATDPVKPAGLRKIYFLAFVFILSCFAALAWVTLAEFFDESVGSEDSLARWLRTESIAPIRLSKPFSAAGIADDVGVAALMLTRVMRHQEGNAVLVCPMEPGAGATTIAKALAAYLDSHAGLRVLLVELSEQLARDIPAIPEEGELTAAVEQPGQGPDLLPASALSGKAIGPALTKLLARVHDDYDIVLVDTPSLSCGTTAILAGRAVPRMLLVAESGRSQRAELERAARQLELEQVTVLAAVLNKQRQYIPNWFNRLFFS